MVYKAIPTNEDKHHTKSLNHRLFTYCNAHGRQILNTTKYLRQKKEGRKEGRREKNKKKPGGLAFGGPRDTGRASGGRVAVPECPVASGFTAQLPRSSPP